MYRFKPALQFLLRPVARWVADHGGTANQVTMLALVGSLLVGAALAAMGTASSKVWLLLPTWMAARMALNALDGMLARIYAQKSHAGAYLNELADVGSDAALILPLALHPSFSPALVVAIALLASWTELAGVLGPSVGASRRHEGPMGKSDRALVVGLLGAWIGWTGSTPPFLWGGQLVVVALLVVTVLRRTSAGLAEAR